MHFVIIDAAGVGEWRRERGGATVSRLANIFRDIKQEVVLTLLFRPLCDFSTGRGNRADFEKREDGVILISDLSNSIEMKGFMVFGFGLDYRSSKSDMKIRKGEMSKLLPRERRHL